MKKKLLLIVLAVVVCIAAVSIYFFCSTSKGDTIESRESMLNTVISRGRDWTISKEIELDSYIISAAYSTDHKSTLAVFEPTGNGNYKFNTSTNRDNKDILGFRLMKKCGKSMEE